MAELKVGTVVDLRKLSPVLAIFRLMPQSGSRFPDYLPGQYIALRRSGCHLTKRSVGPDGLERLVPDLDESGRPKTGSITHSYSIASAPFESREGGYLEFYIVLERDEHGTIGRLSGSLFDMAPPNDTVTYVDRITGNFTLDKRAHDVGSVLLIGTGTGLAPFVSMIKELDHDARRGIVPQAKYTLLHTNRTYEELAYHQELLDIEAARRFDFVYVASVSRPSERDVADPRMGRGRANNMLRHMFGMPTKEAKDVTPVLPRHISRDDLVKRFEPSRTVILTCGNPSSMDDIKYVADTQRIPFEKEDW